MSGARKIPSASLEVFAHKLIDYAGMFPPASLNLPQAFNNYLVYLQGEYKWMVSRFIIGANQLGELSELMKEMKLSEGQAPVLSVLAGGKSGNILDDLKADVSSAVKFIRDNPGSAAVEALEVRLPPSATGNEAGSLKTLIREASGVIRSELGGGISIFFEPAGMNDLNGSVLRLAEAISVHGSPGKITGLKLRTGGTEASAFPSVSQVALTIMACCEFGIQMKCTAGLHHPIRHYDEGVKAEMHGFMNVFGAGILAYVNALDEDEIEEILNEEDLYSFEFPDDRMTFNEFYAVNSDIIDARGKLMISFGSCSIDDPIDGLKMMELL